MCHLAGRWKVVHAKVSRWGDGRFFSEILALLGNFWLLLASSSRFQAVLWVCGAEHRGVTSGARHGCSGRGIHAAQDRGQLPGAGAQGGQDQQPQEDGGGVVGGLGFQRLDHGVAPQQGQAQVDRDAAFLAGAGDDAAGRQGQLLRDVELAAGQQVGVVLQQDGMAVGDPADQPVGFSQARVLCLGRLVTLSMWAWIRGSADQAPSGSTARSSRAGRSRQMAGAWRCRRCSQRVLPAALAPTIIQSRLVGSQCSSSTWPYLRVLVRTIGTQARSWLKCAGSAFSWRNLLGGAGGLGHCPAGGAVQC